MARKSLDFYGQLFKEYGEAKSWKDLGSNFSFDEKNKFKYMQIIHAILRSWRTSTNDPA